MKLRLAGVVKGQAATLLAFLNLSALKVNLDPE